MLNEATLVAKHKLNENASLDDADKMMSKNALISVECISKDEKKLQKFIEQNRDRIEKTLAKMKNPKDRKWYAIAWDVNSDICIPQCKQ